MDPLLGITANTSLFGIGANRAITQIGTLLGSGPSLFASSVFGTSSTVVELSGLGQLLSTATTFQDQLAALRPGTPTSGGGENFGTDVASLAAEAQAFVDAFNNLQSNIANINETSSLLGSGIPGTSGLVLALDTQAQASLANGESALTSLADIGITFQPTTIPGGGGRLSIDLEALKSAFASDGAGAFSLLSEAANTFGDLARDFVSQSGAQFSTLGALFQASAADQFLAGNFLFLAQSGLNGTSAQQVITALNQYALVSTLLG